MGILTNDELIQLTGGLKQGAAQCRWIERQMGFKSPRKIDGQLTRHKTGHYNLAATRLRAR
jgi:hypothetical protein